MRETKSPKTTKVIGAIIPSLVFIIPLVLAIIGIYIAIKNSSIPVIVASILIFIVGAVIICLIVNLISRLKEIYGGEEDEASKY